MSTTAPRFSLKDQLFNQCKVEYLADVLCGSWSPFRRDDFVQAVMQQLPDLPLKARIYHIAEMLAVFLPAEYRAAVDIIVRALPPPLDPTRTDDDFGDFIFAPCGEYVVRYGVAREQVALSLATLEALTTRFSMEDALRAFLRQYPVETLAACKRWTVHPHYHVRRLVSEGTRPRLPWSGRVPLTTSETLPLLSVLYSDRTRYVTRSVANHLNDMAKVEPDVVVATLAAWQTEGRQSPREYAWLTKHALRTLVKQGHQGALALLGFTAAAIEVRAFVVSPVVERGSTLTLTATMQAESMLPVVVDYRIHFIKKGGQRMVKVYKWKTTTLAVGETQLSKQHFLKADATTYTLYPGVHVVELQVNGEVVATTQFRLQ